MKQIPAKDKSILKDRLEAAQAKVIAARRKRNMEEIKQQHSQLQHLQQSQQQEKKGY